MPDPITDPNLGFDDWADQMAAEDHAAMLEALQGNPCLDGVGNIRHMVLQATKESTDTKAMSAKYIIVTRSKQLNLYGNRVQITKGPKGNGLDTSYHERAPVVRLEHGKPIGLSRTPSGKYTVKLTASKATGVVFFSQSDPDGEASFALADEGILGMASIGFYANKGMRIKPPKEKEQDGVENLQRWRLGLWDFVETLLLEWSPTASGADPGAVKQAMERGSINDVRLTPGLIWALTPFADARQAWTMGFTAGQLTQQATQIPIGPVPVAQQVGQIVAQGVAAEVDRTMMGEQSQALDVDTDDDIGTNTTTCVADLVQAYSAIQKQNDAATTQLINQTVVTEVESQVGQVVQQVSQQLAPVKEQIDQTTRYFEQVGLIATQ